MEDYLPITQQLLGRSTSRGDTDGTALTAPRNSRKETATASATVMMTTVSDGCTVELNEGRLGFKIQLLLRLKHSLLKVLSKRKL